MKYLVTGGAGFIGSNIVEALVKTDEQVRVLENFSTGKRENLIPFSKCIEIIEGDIRSYSVVIEAMLGIDVVLHQAALPSVPRSIKDPITTNEVNVVGTLNILQATFALCCFQIGWRKVLSSIFGNLWITNSLLTLL